MRIFVTMDFTIRFHRALRGAGRPSAPTHARMAGLAASLSRAAA